MGRLSRREFIRISTLTAAGVAATACARPTAEVIEKEVTKVVRETVLAAGTPMVIEKEVTKVVKEEVTKVVTATPSPEHEDPVLRAMVQTGQLAPLNERLPTTPLILDRKPYEIGRYGGKLVLASSIFPDETVFALNRDCTATVPNISDQWEASQDGKSFTVHLRKGMKWSDGQPFTADDVLFWYEALVLNDELTPVKPNGWTFGGQLMKVVKQDDYTIKLEFAAPFYYAVHKLNGIAFGGRQDGGADGGFYLPKHYLQQYHIQYNKDADQLAKAAKLEHWYEVFGRYASTWMINVVDVPNLMAWVITKEAATGNSFDRNPYYWKVDAAGSQLPYIGKIQGITWGDNQETRVMQLVAGQVDFEQWDVYVGQWPVLFQNQDKGGYDLWMAGDVWVGYAGFWLNENYKKDPELGKLLADKRFRQALSLAINREEINQNACFGKGVPTQGTCHKSASFYKEDWAKAYAQYDPAAANKLLDEIGLTKRDSEGLRLKPNGDKLSLVIELTTAVGYWEPISELVKAQWQAVGIRTIMTIDQWDLLWTRLGAGELQIFTWVIDAMVEPLLLVQNAVFDRLSWWGPDWYLWLTTKGKQGTEPPEEVKTLYESCLKIPSTPPEQMKALMTGIFDDQAANVRYIGTVGYVGKPCIANKKLGNVDKEVYGNSWDLHGSHNFLPERFFWKE